MHRFFLILLLVFFLPSETFADPGIDPCQRRCGGATFPYPFGFSPGCPIALSCDTSTSTPILPYGGGDDNNGTSYRVISFNSNTSTLVVSLPPSCSRSVPDTRRALSGANYGVSSRTGLFLRGGCRETNATVCSMPAAVMSGLLRTAQCVENGNGTNSSAAGDVACVSSATASGIFLRWEKAESTKCDDVLTSALFGDTLEGTVSLEFGLAELGWWLNGTCSGGSEGCARNATCSEVRTPTGGVGHRCTCEAGMDGDGFLSGYGCYVVVFYCHSRRRGLQLVHTFVGPDS